MKSDFTLYEYFRNALRVEAFMKFTLEAASGGVL